MELRSVLFSVLIPAYKRKFLCDAISSCLIQTYKNFEIIIVDDASPEDLKSVVDQFHDSRIKYYRNEKNCGAINVVDNWNICLSYAIGDYVICMGDDDKLLPNCLEEYVKLIKKYPNIGLLHGWTEIIDEKSNPIRLTVHRCEFESAISLMWHRQHVYEDQFIGDFCFKHSSLKRQKGFFKLPLAWGSDDISALIAASENGVANTQSVVFQYRINSQTISKSGNVEIKLQSIEKEFKWNQNFLAQPIKSHSDKLYCQQMIKELKKYKAKKQGQNLALDMKAHSFFRIFYWWRLRNCYKLEFKTLVFAFIQAHK